MTHIQMVVDSLAIVLGEYSAVRKYAAIILLKYLLPSELVTALLKDSSIYPYKREDNRVRVWKKTVLSIGHCELCGCTENLEAHHIIKWSEYPQGRLDRNNGMCLCLDCHTERHRFDRSYHLMAAKRRG